MIAILGTVLNVEDPTANSWRGRTGIGERTASPVATTPRHRLLGAHAAAMAVVCVDGDRRIERHGAPSKTRRVSRGVSVPIGVSSFRPQREISFVAYRGGGRCSLRGAGGTAAPVTIRARTPPANYCGPSHGRPTPRC